MHFGCRFKQLKQTKIRKMLLSLSWGLVARAVHLYSVHYWPITILQTSVINLDHQHLLLQLIPPASPLCSPPLERNTASSESSNAKSGSRSGHSLSTSCMTSDCRYNYTKILHQFPVKPWVSWLLFVALSPFNQLFIDSLNLEKDGRNSRADRRPGSYRTAPWFHH